MNVWQEMTSERRAHVQRLHAAAPVLDAHCDSFRATMIGDPRYNPPPEGSPTRPRSLTDLAESGHVDFPRAREGGLGGAIFNILLPRPKGRLMVHAILKTYKHVLDDLRAGARQAVLATSVADIERAHDEGKFAVILGIEGAEGLEGDLELLDFFYRLGVRSVGLSWMWRNEVADGTLEDGGNPLTPFGRRAVRKMNELGIVVDTAHLPPASFYDTLEVSERPVICSHTSCRSLVKALDGHAEGRYLSDNQMKELAAQGGVLGIFFSANRELADPDADVHALARFFTHAAEVAGPEHVAMGSDFDGGFPPAGLEDARGLPNLTSALIDAGFHDTEILGILGGNWMRVFRETWST